MDIRLHETDKNSLQHQTQTLDIEQTLGVEKNAFGAYNSAHNISKNFKRCTSWP
jgi:hypothetical protein